MRSARPLTTGEIALARAVFGEAIDYGEVRLVRHKWWPFQPRHTAMAPMGNIHFHPDGGGWSDDFAGEPLQRQAFFIHEMTHVWQAQRKGRFYLPLMRHPFCRYDYILKPGKPFGRYGIEQQAEIVAHRFLADRGAPVATLVPRHLLPFADGLSCG
ncbi:MAG: vgr related protein [Sphingomicrobium sp.]